MKYLRTYTKFTENNTPYDEPTINDIIQNGDEYTITIGDTTATGFYDGGLYSENLPIWATKEFYLENVQRKGFNNNDKYKGYGEKVINLMIDKAKDLGADIFTLRVDDGYGFEGISSNLYSYYKKIGFKDNDEKNPDGGMYKDLRKPTNESLNSEKNDTILLAPNGKKSILNKKQWNQVRTPEFKEWFGDWENDPEHASKVVDSNGEPLICYHGTLGSFTEFKHGRSYGSGDSNLYLGKGFYFTNDVNNADSYSNYDETKTLKLFLNIRTPLVSNDYKHTSPIHQYSFISFLGIDNYSEIQPLLINKGYDGIISNSGEPDYSEKYGESDINYTEYVVFKPNQIKSAIDNNGNFDKNNNNINETHNSI